MTESTEAPAPNGPTALLLKHMRELGYSQGYISRKTGIPQSRLSRWSNGENTGRADDALRLKEFASKLRPKKAKRPAPTPAPAA